MRLASLPYRPRLDRCVVYKSRLKVIFYDTKEKTDISFLSSQLTPKSIHLQYEISVNTCDWHILAGNKAKIVWNCLYGIVKFRCCSSATTYKSKFYARFVDVPLNSK